jgi:RNA polymerase sigma-70 factor (ECF subfamily)
MTRSEPSAVHDLLAQARAGDRSALNRLFALCRSYVHVIAQAQVGTWLQAKVDASDVVQQSLLDAYQGFDRFKGTTSSEWLAWLRRIVANNVADCVQHYQGVAKRRVGLEVPLQDAWGNVIDISATGESPSQELLRKEDELLLADALTRLPPDQRNVIVMRNLQRLPFEEVARRMGRTRPATQMLWLRAIRKLRELLATETSPA